MDSRARLHCCGAHHGDNHTPAGVLLSFAGSADVAYGTGENEQAAVLLLPSGHYPADGLHTKLLADRIARGANVTVVVPASPPGDDEDTGNNKRKRDEGAAEAPTTAAPAERYVAHLERMGVTSIGLLATEIPSRLPAHLSCVVLLTTAETATTAMTAPSPPTSIITLCPPGSARPEASSASADQAASDTTRRTTVETEHDLGLLNDESAKGYTEAMREVLYFFKKHLHDWS